MLYRAWMSCKQVPVMTAWSPSSGATSVRLTREFMNGVQCWKLGTQSE